MKTILNFLRNEPAMVVTFVLAVLNIFLDLNADQAVQVQTIIESALVLLGGGVVRSSVTPTAKLAGK